MEELNKALEKITAGEPKRIIISKPTKDSQYRRVEIDRKKDGYQIASYTEKQVFHKNIETGELAGALSEAVTGNFLQVNAFADSEQFQLMISKKGTVTLKSQKASGQVKSTTDHNRQKNYLLPEGKVIAPLVDMGIFTHDGHVVNSMQDKYRQINRFIEMVDDVIADRQMDSINIIDFGCGKSYLTFIIYYYLTEIKHMTVNAIGLDLKTDVIKKCNEAAKKYGYTGLHFEMGDINGFKCPFDVDMVVTLHACDTATDYALYNAITWNASMILSVPCCQHELNSQIHTDDLSCLTRYGIVKERMSALMTDAIRGNMLEYCGYKTQLLEFIDMEHTPKNILIRAVKRDRTDEASRQKYLCEVKNIMAEFNVSPKLYNLIMQKDFKKITYGGADE